VSWDAAFGWTSSVDGWVAFFTLSVLEIVLGIDNVVFVSILAGKLPGSERERARKLGMFLAMFIRILLLLAITWVMGLTAVFFSMFGHGVTGRDLILIVGGLFLIAKSTHEIHLKLEGDDDHASGRKAVSFAGVIVQILLLDIVFSLDSVITAVGMVRNIPVMVAAIVLAVLVMIFASNPVGEFIDRNPTIRMLALAFIMLVGVVLIGEGIDMHIQRGYIYFAMGFSVMVEMLNLRLRRKPDPPVQLRSNRP